MSFPDLAPALQIIVRRHGEAVLSDRARMHGLLRDYAPAAVSEIASLMRVHDTGSVGRLAVGSLDAAAVEAEGRSQAEALGPGAPAAVELWAGAIAFARNGSAAAPTPLLALQPMPLPPAAPASPARRRWFGLFG